MIENEMTNCAIDAPAYIEKREDGYYIVDCDGLDAKLTRKIEEGKTWALPKNAANRQWQSVSMLDKACANDGKLYLEKKTTPPRKLDMNSSVPNAALIKFLSEEDQAEYKAIIDRARAAREADKKRPLTDIEKAELAVKKAQERLAKLTATEEH